MTSRNLRMDALLAGTLILPWRVHCAGVMSSAAVPVENHSELIVKTIPGQREKPFAFPPESPFTFSPESCSPSPRNAFHVHPGIAFTLPRNPQRAQVHGSTRPEHYVFPACENENIDPTKPQKSWRSAWRSLVKEAAKRAGDEAADLARQSGRDVEESRKNGSAVFQGFRFHDLRHQAITELAEAGAPDATLMALAGHMSREMLEHYSHVRMAAKRAALDKLGGGLMPDVKTAKRAIAGKVQ